MLEFEDKQEVVNIIEDITESTNDELYRVVIDGDMLRTDVPDKPDALMVRVDCLVEVAIFMQEYALMIEQRDAADMLIDLSNVLLRAHVDNNNQLEQSNFYLQTTIKSRAINSTAH